MQLNINSLLPEIDELCNIAQCSSAAVIGITETKLDNTLNDSEVTVERYSMVWNDRNIKGEAKFAIQGKHAFLTT